MIFTLATMDEASIKSVVDLWQTEFEELRSNDWIKYIQIFENKGAVMGAAILIRMVDLGTKYITC